MKQNLFDREQLEMIGVNEARRLADSIGTKVGRTRSLNQIETAHDLLSSLPSPDDLSFLHAGLCQTCLPHSRPKSNSAFWRRSSGKFQLIVAPGILDLSDAKTHSRQPTPEETEKAYVGVPFGPRARLILLHLQTEALRGSRQVSLGPSLAAFLRSLGLPSTGGPSGTIASVREQCLRIARCSFTLQWSDNDERTVVSDTKIVDGLDLWHVNRDDWSGEVEISAKFYEHLKEHAVPLDKRGIALLSGNSLGLDLYALFAYRLPRLTRDLHMTWDMLKGQIGSDYADNKYLARRIREVLPQVRIAYPHAKVEARPTGITLRQSQPAVPSATMVQTLRAIDQNDEAPITSLMRKRSSKKV